MVKYTYYHSDGCWFTTLKDARKELRKVLLDDPVRAKPFFNGKYIKRVSDINDKTRYYGL